MTLAPLLAAPTVIQIHVATALSALALGVVQLAAPKGTIPHRAVGWLWTGLFVLAAGSSFFIHTLRLWGPWSPLHLLSIFTLVMLARAVIAARRHDVSRHRVAMAWMVGAGLVLPAIVAFAPGRVMNRVVTTAEAAEGAKTVGYQNASFPGPDGRPVELGIWYPSDAPATSQPFGPFEQTVARNGAVAGDALPLIVISHGTGGSLGGHYDTAQALVRAGFVVVAPNHPGDNFQDRSASFTARNFADRARQVTAVIDYMLATWPGRDRMDPARIGMFGHSAGGITTLIVAGGVPDPDRGGAFCRDHADDWGCKRAQARSVSLTDEDRKPPSWVSDPRVKAFVVAAPAATYVFGPQSLAHVTVPIQLWEAADDHIVPNGLLRPILPAAPELHVVANAGHFDFLAQCSAVLAEHIPEICKEGPGFDRAAFHRQFNKDLTAFLAARLGAP